MSELSGGAILARRYRLLLLTYPRSYRRQRGEEIVTTLMDAAPTGRARPTRTEVVDLLLGGFRHRFRVRGAGGLLVAGCGALIAMVALGAFGGFLGWQTAPPLPGNDEATRMLQPALPAGAAPVAQRWDWVFDNTPKYTADARWVYWVTGTDEYEHGQVFFDVPHRDDARSGAAVVGEAERRMRAAGWSVVSRQDDPDRPSSVVARGGWRAEIAITSPIYRDDRVMRVAITRAVPGAVVPLTTFGLLAGALLGWLLAGGLTGRSRPGDRGRPSAGTGTADGRRTSSEGAVSRGHTDVVAG